MRVNLFITIKGRSVTKAKNHYLQVLIFLKVKSVLSYESGPPLGYASFKALKFLIHYV